MYERELKIAPSILSSDFSHPDEALRTISESGLDYVHLDVMDGNFVPVITFGPKLIKDLRKKSDLIFDVHLMIQNPERMIEEFLDAGSDIITVHAEATDHIYRCIELIKEGKREVGVAINPGTPVSFIYDILPSVDYVLIMSVSPGWGGQKMIKETLRKIETLYKIREEERLRFLISTDGGINEDNINLVRDAGTDIAVIGSAFFSKEDKIGFLEDLERRLSQV